MRLLVTGVAGFIGSHLVDRAFEVVEGDVREETARDRAAEAGGGVGRDVRWVPG